MDGVFIDEVFFVFDFVQGVSVEYGGGRVDDVDEFGDILVDGVGFLEGILDQVFHVSGLFLQDAEFVLDG